MFNLCSSTWPKSQLRADWAQQELPQAEPGRALQVVEPVAPEPELHTAPPLGAPERLPEAEAVFEHLPERQAARTVEREARQAPTPLLDAELAQERAEEQQRRRNAYRLDPALQQRHEAELLAHERGDAARARSQASAQAQIRIDWHAGQEARLLAERHEREREALHERQEAAQEREPGALGKLWQGVRKIVMPGRVAAEEQARERTREAQLAERHRLEDRQGRERAAQADKVQRQRADEQARLQTLKEAQRREMQQRQRRERERVLTGQGKERGQDKDRSRGGRGEKGKGGWEK